MDTQHSRLKLPASKQGSTLTSETTAVLLEHDKQSILHVRHQKLVNINFASNFDFKFNSNFIGGIINRSVCYKILA